MAFNGGGGDTKDVSIRILADVNGLKKSVADAQRSLGGLTGHTNKLGDALIGVQKQAGALGGAFGASIGMMPEKFGGLVKEVVATNARLKEQGDILGGLTKKLITAEMVIGGLGKAWQAVGNYMQGAFERSKVDPALAGINQMRQLTEDWTTAWQSAVDRVLNTIAGGLYGDETVSRRGRVSTNAKDYALRKLGFDPENITNLERRVVENSDAYGSALDEGKRWAEERERSRETARSNAAQKQLLAQGLTSAAIARDLGFAGVGQLSPALLQLGQSIVGDRYGGIQGQGIVGGFQRLWGEKPKKKPGGGSSAPTSGGVFGVGADYLQYGVNQAWNTGSGIFTGFGGGSFDGAGFGGLLGLGQTVNDGDLDAMYGVGGDARKDAASAFFGGAGAGVTKVSGPLDAAKEALSGFSDALGASVAASLAAGEMSAKAAFKAAAAEMKALAIKSGVLALASGVKAIFGNPLAAKEAAGHAATAAAAGAAYATLSGLAGGGGSGGGAAPGGGSGYGGGGGYSSQPASYFVPHGSRDGSGPNAQNVTINIGVAGEGAGQVIATELEKARQSGRHRSESTRVVKYE
jgi:hypothetical protein